MTGTYCRSGDETARWACNALARHGADVAGVAGHFGIIDRLVHCGAGAGDIVGDWKQG
jgi:hypothetical protein